MSGDLTYVQDQMMTDEFITNLKSLSMPSSSNNYADTIKRLHTQLKHAMQAGLCKNKQFTFRILENAYRVVPVFEKILSTVDKNGYNNLIETKSFLETLATGLNDICLFDIFGIVKDTKPIEMLFQNYIGLLKESYFTDNNKYDNLVNCLLPIILYSSVMTSVTEDKLPSNLLSYVLTFTKRNLFFKHRELLVKNTLSLIKVFSKNPALVALIIRTEWPHACVQWIGNINDKHGLRPSYVIDYHIHLIIQKLARHTSGVQILNELNCLKHFEESEENMKKSHTEYEYNCLHFLQCMIYTLLVEADEIKKLSMLKDDFVCQAINDLVSHIILASRHERFSYNCFHISEMLVVLSKLFVNDDIVLKSINENNELFDCLCQLMVHFANITRDTNQNHLPFNDETLLALVNLLWSISFLQNFHEKFQANTALMHVISNLATLSLSDRINTQMKVVPRDMCSLKKGAEGILWNLRSSSSVSNQVSDAKPAPQSQQPLAMISYSHSDATFCRELVEHLSAHVPVWVDYKQAKHAIAHSDDLWEEIAHAMEMATVIVLIVSKEYYNSKSCRQELSYASDTLKKRIIPIYPPNQQYRASGWLGIRIAGQKYIHFGRKLFTEAIKELSSMTLTEIKSIGVPPPLSSSSLSLPSITCTISESVAMKTSEGENQLSILKSWTAKDIQKWFEDNHIHKDLIAFYSNQFRTGTALIIYARHLKLFYRSEYLRVYKNYSKMFHKKKLVTTDFIAFVDALYRLRMEYDPNATMEDNHDKCNEQKVPCIFKLLENADTPL